MKFRIAIAAMLVAVGIGAVWVLTTSEKGEAVVGADDRAERAAIPANQVSMSQLSVVQMPTNQTPTVRGTVPFVVKSSVTIDKPMRLEIEAMGARMVASLSDDTLLVEADAAVRAKLVGDARFSKSAELQPSAKIEPSLAAMLADGAESVDVSVIALAEADRALVRSVVEQGGGEVLKGVIGGKAMFKARLPAVLVSELAVRGDVRWLEPFERPHLMNDVAVDPKAMNIRPIWQSEENPDGLSGAGQIITTSDSGIDTGDLTTMHEDLRTRVIGIGVVAGCNKTDVNGHGTHTAGSIAGDGTKSGGRIRGTAWGAHLWAWFCGAGDGGRGIDTPDTAAELFRPEALKEGTAYIHSASWGSDTAGRYTTDCQEYDTYVWEHADFLPVFAAGNSGSARQTVGSPAAAKNLLTVGSTQNLRTEPDQKVDANGDPTKTANYSSRGPCADGRIKPDVASPGTGVLSTRSHGVEYSYGLAGGDLAEFYAYDTGTSMATPLTAGSVALIREWLLRRDEFADEETETAKRPTAALMKAIITGGAKDAATPNSNQGWGRVDIAETLYPSDRAVRLVDRIPFAANTNFVYVVETTNAAPLDVQLVWVDYPGDATTRRQLVNDLDLTVEASHDGVDEFWYGNGGTKADTVNNVESVRVPDAAPTKYIVTVNCKRILHDHTEGGAAALYIRGAFDPEARPEPPVNVRIPERDLDFRLLKQAVVAVQEGETIEVLGPVNVSEKLTLKVDCTIVSTNEDAFASAVNVHPGTGLTVAAGARVLFQNLVLTNAAAVTVQAGGTLALSGLVVPGQVTTADVKGLELAGRIERWPVEVYSPKVDLGDAFGIYSTTPEVAAACADLFVNMADDELIGAVGGGRLQWGLKPVDDADAIATIDEGGGNATNFRSFRMLLKCLTNDATVVVHKTCGLGGEINVDKSVTLAGDGVGIAVTNLSLSPTSFTIVMGGTLTIENLTLSGMRGEKFISVEGGRLTLEDGATLSDIVLKSRNTQGMTYGAVTLLAGDVTMRSGSRIESCKAGGNYGGGIYALGGLVSLEGGTITNCHAGVYGGGVYVNTVRKAASIRISGDVTVRGNTITNGDVSGEQTDNDIELARDVTSRNDCLIEVVGPLTGSVGIKNKDDTALAAVFSYSNLPEPEKSAAALHSNLPPDKDGKVLVASVKDDTFVWKRVPPYVEEGTEGAVVRLVYPTTGTRQSYMTLGEAFKYMEGDCVVELLTTSLVYSANISVNYDVTIRSAPELGEICRLSRTNDCHLIVGAGRSVTLADVCLDVAGEVASEQPIVMVDGGALTLESGAVVSGLRKKAQYVINGSPASGICVNDGTLTMKSGSCVTDCKNLWADVIDNVRVSGKGGGVALYGASTGYFEGGSITNCQAEIGGGLAVWNTSRAFVSGDFAVRGNLSAVTNTTSSAPYLGSDIAVGSTADLSFVGPLTDEARLGFRTEYSADTNLVANVPNWAQSWESVEYLATNAAQCFRSDATKIRGVAVTNATDAVIVWGSAIGEDGSYRSGGQTYYAVPEVPSPDPEPDPEFAIPLPIAFKSITYADDIVTLVITDAVQWCNYSLFATNSLEGGFAITNAAGEFVVAPATNFQWKATDPEIKLEFPSTDAQRFWRATAAEGLIPAK